MDSHSFTTFLSWKRRKAVKDTRAVTSHSPCRGEAELVHLVPSIFKVEIGNNGALIRC